jgi:hypothetical protein
MGKQEPPMEHLAAVVQAIASLAWVGFAFTALFMFKPEITGALSRLTGGEILGQKFELSKDLMKLEGSVAAMVKERQELPAETNRMASADQDEKFEATIKPILQQAATSPKVALVSLGAELEKKAMQGLATRGILRGRQVVPLGHALSELGQYGFPPNLLGSLELFNGVRNKIIHGAAATDDDALKALDSGMTILRALDALPNEVNVVYHPGVEIFLDDACTTPFPDVKGVILEVTSPGGVMKTKRIYPTTRRHFQKGKQLAWEWNTNKQWPGAWYRDPDSGEIMVAWGGSTEFIGRHLDDIPTPEQRT